MKAFATGVALFAAANVAVVATPKADQLHYAATLTGAAETPPNEAKGSGNVIAIYDTDTKKLQWTIYYSDLTGPAIGAHFHGPAPVGKPAPIEVPLEPPLDSPMFGSATLTDAQAKDLADGTMYFNIHTAQHEQGEIRGQMEGAK